ncbi:photosystem II reaction center protein Psb28 [Leptolyngbyaceae cyanobacterium CCMR0082]|uniref:Photosystem II reaction center Psb28 protein n=2 Tax=Adonisia turfae TaxID=2950184 RepID=A0A6M0SIH1_9CYAN|nr:photosystem II reaction center protein Psb28 [Adonisia turfae]MDV3353173.1 photosystem II reaction center protein Psb28 [Leptothoe sp. LEGE 181152]NEZ59767.1 photosystem II reaction center protein Psb28 [Adonisia turfae CCMR0081]NEZ68164.1 photosystem II reaction center protein Psb28 [Adonisia turfae CCMR0082]
MAEIQFAQGVAEEVIPDVRLTRAKDGSDGTATFYFDKPKALVEEGFEVTGLYLVDEEGMMTSREVNAKFINGAPAGLEARILLKSRDEWDRFMRFMNRYAEEKGLGFTKS